MSKSDAPRPTSALAAPRELTEDEVIGERVHMQMFRARITQTTLARQLGMQQSGISRRLRGERAWLATEVVAIARVLGVSVGDLMPDITQAPEPIHPSPAGPGAVNTRYRTHCQPPTGSNVLVMAPLPRPREGQAAA